MYAQGMNTAAIAGNGAPFNVNVPAANTPQATPAAGAASAGVPNMTQMQSVNGVMGMPGVDVSNMSLPNMQTLGMPGMQNMTNLQGMQGMQGMQTVPNLQGMQNINNVPMQTANMQNMQQQLGVFMMPNMVQGQPQQAVTSLPAGQQQPDQQQQTQQLQGLTFQPQQAVAAQAAPAPQATTPNNQTAQQPQQSFAAGTQPAGQQSMQNMMMPVIMPQNMMGGMGGMGGVGFPYMGMLPQQDASQQAAQVAQQQQQQQQQPAVAAATTAQTRPEETRGAAAGAPKRPLPGFNTELQPAEDRSFLPDVPSLKSTSSTPVSGLAGAIAKRIREHGTADIVSLGSEGTNQTVKAMALARTFLNPEGRTILAQSRFINEDDEINVKFRADGVAVEVVPEDTLDVVIRVSASSNVRKTAGAIAKLMRGPGSQGQRIGILTMGAESVNVTIQALTGARTMLHQDSLDVHFKPRFIHVDDEVSAQPKPALQLNLQLARLSREEEQAAAAAAVMTM